MSGRFVFPTERRLVLKKTAALVIALVLVSLLALGCGTPQTSSATPSQVVKVFLDAILRNDPTAAYALLAAADKKGVKTSDWKKLVADQAASAGQAGPVSVNVKGAKTSGDGSVVSVEIKQGKDTAPVSIAVVKEGGGWKVSLQQSEGINSP